tara:strand:- start:1589 stop:1792 length:204 start_codon:yes stop_codon:yes gene_type:complete
MKEVKEYVEEQLSLLDKSIVSTPDEDYLDRFVQANHGSSDYLLMQMSKQLGYRMALLEVQELYTNKK